MVKRLRILPAGVGVIDDPTRRRGLRSKPFDGEGVPTAPLVLVEDGELRSWVLDGRSGRQLGLASTGNASPQQAAAAATTRAGGPLQQAIMQGDAAAPSADGRHWQALLDAVLEHTRQTRSSDKSRLEPHD